MVLLFCFVFSCLERHILSKCLFCAVLWHILFLYSSIYVAFEKTITKTLPQGNLSTSLYILLLKVQYVIKSCKGFLGVL